MFKLQNGQLDKWAHVRMDDGLIDAKKNGKLDQLFARHKVFKERICGG